MTDSIFDVPAWLNELIARWADRLGLTHWRILVEMTLAPGGHVDAEALCEQFAQLNQCKLWVRVDAEDNEHWRTNIIHELLHVAHTRIDSTVENVLVADMDENAREMAFEAYRQAYEPYIHRMAVALYVLTECMDYGE